MIRKFLIFLSIVVFFTFSSSLIFGEGENVLVLDAGHGGSDTGIVKNNFVEKNIDLKIVKIIGKKLKDKVKVVYTRTGDVDVSLENRVITANNSMGNLFISIHCGAYLSAENFGLIYILNGNDIQNTSYGLLEQKIGDKTVKFFPFNIAGYYFLPKSREFGTSLLKSLNNFYGKNFLENPIQLKLRILENIAMPGIVIEVGNLNSKNFSDTDDWYNTISSIICDKIIEFFNISDKNNE